MWWILLDVLVAAVMVYYVYSCAKKGFAKAAMEVAALIIAYFLASTFSGILAGWAYDSCEEKFISDIEEKIMDEADATLSSTLPDYIVTGAQSLGIYDDILESQRGTARETAVALCARVAKPVFTSIVRMGSSIVIFLILMFVFRYVIKIVNKAFKLPVIDGLNTFLGGVFGILKGGMVLLMISFGVSVLMIIFDGSFLIFSQDNIEKSYLFGYIYNMNPFI